MGKFKPKLNKCVKDKELFWYLDQAGKKKFAYRHRYYDVLGKRKEKSSQGFTSEAAAYRALCEVRAKLVTGNSIEVEHENMKVAQWLDIWFESNEKEWKPNTLRQRKAMIKDQFKPLLGKYRLSSLDKETYKREFIQPLLKDYKPSTVRLFHRVFKVAINAAVDNEIVPRNRFTKVKIANSESAEIEVLEKDDFKKVLSYTSEKENITVNTMIHFFAFTGARRGEVLGLQWRDINFATNEVTFDRQRYRKDGKDVIGELKTKNSYRTIDIDPVITSMFKKYKTWCKELCLMNGRALKEDDFIFISYQTCEPFSQSALLYAFRRIREGVEIQCNLTPHTWRHTHATYLLLTAKIDVTVVADRLGNTPKVVWETYAHVLKDAKKEVVEIFSEAVKF